MRSFFRNAGILMAMALPAACQAPFPDHEGLAFDTVSIKPSKPGTIHSIHFAVPEDNGYRASGQSIHDTLLIAFYPSWDLWTRDSIRNEPKWMTDDLYDIDGHLSPDQAAAWKDQGSTHPLLSAMLLTMLRDRCHLQTHTVVIDLPVHVLEVRKGVTLQPVEIPATAPAGGQLQPDGSYIVPLNDRGEFRFVGATMADIASTFSHWGVGTVTDGTGLTGRYNVTIRRWDAGMTPEQAHLEPRPDDLHYFQYNEAGFILRPDKRPGYSVVIDHIDRPTQN